MKGPTVATRSVPAAKKSINQDIFVYTIPGTTKKIKMRSVETMSMREIRAFKTNAQEEIPKLAVDAASLELIDTMPRRALNELMGSWAKGDEISLGKSSAS